MSIPRLQDYPLPAPDVARRKIPDCFAGNSELLNPIKNV